LEKVGTKPSVKKLWRVVRQLTGREREPPGNPAVTAETLNQHYANVSTDASYDQPLPKDTVAGLPGWYDCITDYEVFKMLDTLRPWLLNLNSKSVTLFRLMPRSYAKVDDLGITLNPQIRSYFSVFAYRSCLWKPTVWKQMKIYIYFKWLSVGHEFWFVPSINIRIDNALHQSTLHNYHAMHLKCKSRYCHHMSSFRQ